MRRSCWHRGAPDRLRVAEVGVKREMIERHRREELAADRLHPEALLGAKMSGGLLTEAQESEVSEFLRADITRRSLLSV